MPEGVLLNHVHTFETSVLNLFIKYKFINKRILFCRVSFELHLTVSKRGPIIIVHRTS